MVLRSRLTLHLSALLSRTRPTTAKQPGQGRILLRKGRVRVLLLLGRRVLGLGLVLGRRAGAGEQARKVRR
ncbi:hypothetical protein BDY21DRAFT_338487 [Lineolata rhizophorae]|uniref:Uncharacterized protein n=1 Tax=Lineolata rhizophorae TaxID=578093 RepID=A0A6A6P7X6_9PEZI|nr:hypothetical protein BDY21DRAFT_338487 [Lineolata rhizophorae]